MFGALPKTGRIPLKIRAGFTFDREPRVWAHEKESGEEVGYVFGMSCAVGEYAAVRDAEIDPKWRGKGVYPSMLKALRDIAQQNGCAGVVSRASGRIKDMSTKSWKKFADREPRVREEAGDYYLSALPKTGRISLATAKKALKLLPPGRKACGITAQSLREGMEVEREHHDVTKLGLKKTALIAAAHLCEAKRYYPELKNMERKLKRRK